MKIKIFKRKLNKHLDNISRAINPSVALPSLQGILFTVSGSNIQMIASDGNLAIKELIEIDNDIEVMEQGKILIPGRLFKDVISKQGDKITLEASTTKITITSEGSKTEINLLDKDDFPTISFDGEGKEFNIEAGKLRELIKNVAYASADNDKRLILNGVNLEAANNTLIATSTNSFRLARESVEIDSNTEFNITIISKNLKDFLPEKAKGVIQINVADTKIITRHESTIILSRVIDGVYPEVSRLIPTDFQNVVQIDAKEIANVIDKAMVVSNSDKKVVRLTVTSEELTIESRKSEIGETIVKTRNFKYDGAPFKIAFNAQFLKDAVSRVSGAISINFNGDQKPFIVKSNNIHLTQLILPHRSY